MRGRAAAAKRRFEELIATAWHVEAFARAKKLPPLEQLFREKGSKKGSDDAAVIAMLERLSTQSTAS